MAQRGVERADLPVLDLRELNNVGSNAVGVGVVVAVLRGVDTILVELIVAFEVCLQRLVEFRERVLFVIVNEFLMAAMESA